MCLIVRKPSIFTRIRFALEKYPITKKQKIGYCIRLCDTAQFNNKKSVLRSPFNVSFIWQKNKLYKTDPKKPDIEYYDAREFCINNDYTLNSDNYYKLTVKFFHILSELDDAIDLFTQIKCNPSILGYAARYKETVQMVIVKCIIPAGSIYIKGDCSTANCMLNSGICTNQLIINNFTPLQSTTLKWSE